VKMIRQCVLFIHGPCLAQSMECMHADTSTSVVGGNFP
jgi:hypothetical protein